MRKIVTLFLSVLLILSTCLTISAYTDIDSDSTVAEAVEVLSDLDILTGFEDGSFKPEATVTRAQMAKIICLTLNLETGNSATTVFEDVPVTHWAAKYINTISSYGIIKGYGNGNFGPEDTVTYEQAVKMIVCALGYEPVAIEKGGWSTGYIQTAASLGLLNDANSSNRGDIAVLVYRALETPVMEQTSYGSNSSYEILDGSGYKEYKTLLTKREIYSVTGVVGEVCNENKILITVTSEAKNSLFKADNTYKFDINNTSIADYIYQEVEFYVQKNRKDYLIVSIKTANDSETFTLLSDDIVSINNNKVKYYINASNSTKTKTITIDSNIAIEFNKNNSSVTDLSSFKDKKDIELVFIENDGDTSYDAVIAVQYTSEKLTKVDAFKNKITLGGKTIELDYEDEDKTYVFIDEKGNELSLDDFAEGDVIAWYCDTDNVKTADYIKVILLTDAAVQGEITSVNSNGYIYIDDEKYDVADSAWTKVNTPGLEGTFYLGYNNKIIDFEGTSIANNYGYILQTCITAASFEDTIVVEILTPNGVKQYATTKGATEMFEDIFGKNYFNIDWNIDLEVNRFITYKVNSSGKLSKIEKVTNKFTKYLNQDEYDDNTEAVHGYYVNKDTMIFMINDNDTDNLFVTDIDYLVDEGSYTGAVYAVDGDIEVMFITDTDTNYDNNAGLAIVTGITTRIIKDEKVIEISYVQDGVEDIIYFDEETNVTDKTFKIGSVFMFNSTNTKYVTKYMLIADVINYETFEFNKTFDSAELGSDVDILIGYIFNETAKTNSKGEIITFSSDGFNIEGTYVITDETNTYTFGEDAKKNIIDVDDFLSGDAYYLEVEDNAIIATPILLKIVNGRVIDIYSISSRINILK